MDVTVCMHGVQKGTKFTSAFLPRDNKSEEADLQAGAEEDLSNKATLVTIN